MFCKRYGVRKISKHYGVGHGSALCRLLFLLCFFICMYVLYLTFGKQFLLLFSQKLFKIVFFKIFDFVKVACNRGKTQIYIIFKGYHELPKKSITKKK